MGNLYAKWGRDLLLKDKQNTELTAAAQGKVSQPGTDTQMPIPTKAPQQQAVPQGWSAGTYSTTDPDAGRIHSGSIMLPSLRGGPGSRYDYSYYRDEQGNAVYIKGGGSIEGGTDTSPADYAKFKQEADVRNKKVSFLNELAAQQKRAPGKKQTRSGSGPSGQTILTQGTEDGGGNPSTLLTRNK